MLESTMTGLFVERLMGKRVKLPQPGEIVMIYMTHNLHEKDSIFPCAVVRLDGSGLLKTFYVNGIGLE